MGRLTDDMTRLRHDTDNLRQDRQEFIVNLKDQVADMQTGFQGDRADMSEKLQAGLDEFVSGLKNSVITLQSGFQSDHAEMAKNLHEELDDYMAALKTSVFDMQTSFRDDHNDMAQKLHEELDIFVSTLKKSVASMQSQFSTEHTEMAMMTKAAREEFVGDLKQKTADLCGEFAADIAGARLAWAGNSHVVSKVQEVVIPPKVTSVQTVEELITKAASDKNVISQKKKIQDDLTQIKGIGSGRERFLNEEGIYSFTQLAECIPEDLKEKMGEAALTVAAVGEWTKEAQKLAE